MLCNAYVIVAQHNILYFNNQFISFDPIYSFLVLFINISLIIFLHIIHLQDVESIILDNIFKHCVTQSKQTDWLK